MLSGRLQVSFTADRPCLASAARTGQWITLVDYRLRAREVLEGFLMMSCGWLSLRRLQGLAYCGMLAGMMRFYIVGSC